MLGAWVQSLVRELKIPHATTKTGHSQITINKSNYLKKKKKNHHLRNCLYGTQPKTIWIENSHSFANIFSQDGKRASSFYSSFFQPGVRCHVATPPNPPPHSYTPDLLFPWWSHIQKRSLIFSFIYLNIKVRHFQAPVSLGLFQDVSSSSESFLRRPVLSGAAEGGGDEGEGIHPALWAPPSSVHLSTLSLQFSKQGSRDLRQVFTLIMDCPNWTGSNRNLHWTSYCTWENRVRIFASGPNTTFTCHCPEQKSSICVSTKGKAKFTEFWWALWS